MRALLSSRSPAWRAYTGGLPGLRHAGSPSRARGGRSAFSTSRSVLGANAGSSLGKLGGLKSVLRVSQEVQDALATNRPVVALESTIYTHGAISDLRLEEIVREHGGVPAVVGILDGAPTVGLLPGEVTRMVEESPRKVSRRDIAYLAGMGMTGQRLHGGTTIAGTMLLARLAGIRVFGTGGLGGVHSGGHVSMDISADLTELGRTRMGVVCAGSKGFLDIPRTLEYLETQGVLVSTFSDGRRGAVDFPAFWARDSGVKSPSVVDTEEQAAAMILAQERLEIESGLLFANPIPEEFAIPRSEMDAVIEQAVRESNEQGASGNENTPFILRRIRDLTDGRSVPANKALVQWNVERATKVAVAVSRLISGDLVLSNESKVSPPPRPELFKGMTIPDGGIPEVTENDPRADILVAGSVAVDLSCDYTGIHGDPQLQTSNPAHISQSIGGVGHNVALAAHRVSQDTKVKLCSMVGDDIAGSSVISSLQSSGMDTSYIRQLSHEYHPATRTAQYVAVNDADKNLVLAMADMGIFTAHSFPTYWESAVAASRPRWLVVDANWADRDIRAWARAGQRCGARIAFEPVSVEKSARLFCKSHGHQQQQKNHSGKKLESLEGLGVFPTASVDLATPNQHELAAMHAAARENEYLEDARWWGVVNALGLPHGGARDRFVRLTSARMTDAGIPQQAVQLLPYIPTIVTKLGAEGALLTTVLRPDDPRLRDAASEPYILSRSLGGDSSPDVGGVYMRLYPAAERVENVASVNGVGDTFLGVLIAGLARGGRVEDLVDVAQKGATLTLRSRESVSEDLAGLERELVAAATVTAGKDN